MKLVLTGIQGSGKSTQGNLLSKQLRIPYLSTGHIFREIAKEKTKLGRYVKETINAGLLIPDDKVIKIVNEYLARPEYKRGYILDGFPRTLKQAKRFKNNIDRIIYLKIPDRDALWRLAYRNEVMRGDETLPAIKKRIELFHTHTQPVIKHYEKEDKLVEIDGTLNIKEVNKEILKSLGKQLIEKHIRNWGKKQKAIIAIVGLPGVGKTEAADYYKKDNLPVILFGQMVNDYIDKNHLSHTEEVHKNLRDNLRVKYGKGAFAILNEDKIKKALINNLVVIIDGMRSWEEYLYIKQKFPHVKVYILALFTDKDIRYKRIASRKYRSKLFGEQRDTNELIDTNMGPTIAFADFLIKNNFSLEEFHDKLDEVYRQVYFS